jgi:hypothetical protein
MADFMDLTGDVYGRLIVIEQAPDYVGPGGRRRVQWRCDCACGNKDVVVGARHLRSGRSQSCGCLMREIVSAIKTNPEPGYSGWHQRLRRTLLGQPADHACIDCDQPAAEWSYQGDCPEERTELMDGWLARYCLHAEHYLPRCVLHHVLNDRGHQTHCQRSGHLLPDEPDAQGRRVCRECANERNRERDAIIRPARLALGVTLREYRRLFGRSVVMAEAVLWAAEACAAAQSAD